MAKQILVYGSLRKGYPANRMLDIRHAELVDDNVRVPGFDLFKVAWYPGVRPNPDNKRGFVGELYKVPDHLWPELIQTLDIYEGYSEEDEKENNLFVRQEIEVNGEPTTLYVYNRNTDNSLSKVIPSGDWKDAPK